VIARGCHIDSEPTAPRKSLFCAAKNLRNQTETCELTVMNFWDLFSEWGKIWDLCAGSGISWPWIDSRWEKSV